MHGWESNASRWRSLIKALSDTNFRIVAIDAPGHGASSNETFDMLQYIAAIDQAVKSFEVDTLIGHSVGGASICFYLSRYNAPVFDHLILLGSPAKLSQMTENYFDILKLPNRLKRLFNIHFERKFELTVGDISVSKMIKNVQIPTLIIHDKKDEVINVKDAKVYEHLFTNSSLQITDGYGHGLQNKAVFYKIKSYLKAIDN